MVLIINGNEYSVRHNYLHRGNTPRLVLNVKESGGLVSVQFDDNIKAEKDLKTEKEWRDKSYKGYWCRGSEYKDIEIIVKQKNDYSDL